MNALPQPPPLSFPVVLYNENRYIEAGTVEIQPSFDVNKLQIALCNNIGIFPHQANFLIICRRKTKPTRRIPIKDSVNYYSILAQEKDCYFLVSLKPSKKGQRTTARTSNPPQQLLHRQYSFNTPYYDPFYSRQLQIEKENYLMNSYPYLYGGYGNGGGTGMMGTGSFTVCEVCLQARGGPVPFHCCVYDQTVVGFRSRAGPVQRPSSKG